MRLERATAYGILALVHLAGCDTALPQQVHQISKETGVPVEYLRKLMGRLARARLISSTRGRHGGFRLAKLARTITVLEIVEAIEGPVDAASILDEDLVKSRRGSAGKLLDKWRQRSAVRLRAILEETRLSDLAPR